MVQALVGVVGDLVLSYSPSPTHQVPIPEKYIPSPTNQRRGNTHFKLCVCVCWRTCVPNRFSFVWLFATLWTVSLQAPLTMGFSRQEYWSRLPCPPPGGLPAPGIEPMSLVSPALAGRLFTTSATWEAYIHKVGSCKDTEIHTHTQTHNIYIPSHLPTLDLYLFNVKLKGFDSMVFNVYDWLIDKVLQIP